MKLRTKTTAAAVAVMVSMSGVAVANPANAAGLGAAGHSKSDSDKKKSDKKKSDKKKSGKKKSKKSSASKKRSKIVKIARSKKGANYSSGATGPKSFDCSGFTKYVYKKAGVKKLPRTSSSQKGAGKKISVKKAKKGDIIWSPGHVGIVTKKGKMVDAGNSRVGVSERSYSWMSDAKVIRVKALR